MELSSKSLLQARKRIEKLIAPTPAVPALFLDKRTKGSVWLKLESLNVGGSFKIRGATNALMQIPKHELQKGVIAASAGNHAQGVASTCRLLGAKCRIFMPENTPLIKLEATKTLGAEIQLVGQPIDDALKAAEAYQLSHGGTFVHAFANADVIAGQGTIGHELLEQISDIETVVVPIGGGGLISGIACVIKERLPNAKIIGVQTESYPSMKVAFSGGDISKIVALPTIADGIAIKKPSEMTLEIIKKYVDDIVTVSEDEIAAAVMLLMERGHLLAEGAGAASVAGFLNLAEKGHFNSKGGATVCIISGGNIDVNLLKRIMVRGLIYSGRQMTIRVRVYDRPGNLAQVLNLIGKTGANVMEIHHHRVQGTATQFAYVDIEIELETTNREHQISISHLLKEQQVSFQITLPSEL